MNFKEANLFWFEYCKATNPQFREGLFFLAFPFKFKALYFLALYIYIQVLKFFGADPKATTGKQMQYAIIKTKHVEKEQAKTLGCKEIWITYTLKIKDDI